jgi:hypothetical protein
VEGQSSDDATLPRAHGASEGHLSQSGFELGQIAPSVVQMVTFARYCDCSDQLGHVALDGGRQRITGAAHIAIRPDLREDMHA